MTSIETFLWGLFGGFSAEVSVWFALRHQAPNEFPYWTKSWTYYAPALFMIVIGGGMALAYARSGTTLSAVLAIQIGASAPLILRKLRDTVPETPEPLDPAKID